MCMVTKFVTIKVGLVTKLSPPNVTTKMGLMTNSVTTNFAIVARFLTPLVANLQTTPGEKLRGELLRVFLCVSQTESATIFVTKVCHHTRGVGVRAGSFWG